MSTNLVILWISGRAPERDGNRIVIPNQSGDSAGALTVQMLLAGTNEGYADPLAATTGRNRKPIHVPPPTIPRGDKYTHERALAFGDEQAPRGFRKQTLHVLQVVGGARVGAARLMPELEHCRRVLRLTHAHSERRVSQAVSLLRRSVSAAAQRRSVTD